MGFGFGATAEQRRPAGNVWGGNGSPSPTLLQPHIALVPSGPATLKLFELTAEPLRKLNLIPDLITGQKDGPPPAKADLARILGQAVVVVIGTCLEASAREHQPTQQQEGSVAAFAIKRGVPLILCCTYVSELLGRHFDDARRYCKLVVCSHKPDGISGYRDHFSGETVVIHDLSPVEIAERIQRTLPLASQ